jgi:hypothetical protein
MERLVRDVFCSLASTLTFEGHEIPGRDEIGGWDDDVRFLFSLDHIVREHMDAEMGVATTRLVLRCDEDLEFTAQRDQRCLRRLVND